MSGRAATLATRFEQANALLRDTVAALTDAQWHAHCPGEGWSVGVTAHHIVASHQIVLGFVQQAAAGEPLPAITVEQMDAGNAELARQSAGCTREETLALLHETNRSGAVVLRALTDAQLQRTVSLPGRDLTVERMVMDILIGHVEGAEGHLNSIRAAAVAAGARHPVHR